MRDENLPSFDQCVACPFGTKSNERANYSDGKLVVKYAEVAYTKCSVCMEYEKCPGGNVTLPPDIEVLWYDESHDENDQGDYGTRRQDAYLLQQQGQWEEDENMSLGNRRDATNLARIMQELRQIQGDASERMMTEYGLNVTRLVSCREKVSKCGSMQQVQQLVYLFRDNLMHARPLNVTVQVKEETMLTVFAQRSESDPYLYVCNISLSRVGDHMLRVMVEGKELPNSPFIVHVVPRRCAEGLTAGELGDCICTSGPTIGRQCVSYSTIFAIVVPIVCMCLIFALCFMRHKVNKADSLWKIKASELLVGVPPVQLGVGTFGIVIQAEYR